MLAMAAAQLGYRCHVYSPEKDSVAAEVSARFTCAEWHDRDGAGRVRAGLRGGDLRVRERAGRRRSRRSRPSCSPPAPARSKWRRTGCARSASSRSSAAGRRRTPRSTSTTSCARAIERDRHARHPQDPPRRLRRQGPVAHRLGARGRGPARAQCRAGLRGPGAVRGRVLGHPGARARRRGALLGLRRRTCTKAASWRARSLPPAGDRRRRKWPRRARWRGKVAEALGYVGVLTLEFFATAQGPVFNEMAPRVHNSGHWTIEGAVTSQFENHIRAICGLPLGDTARRSRRVEMAQPDRRRRAQAPASCWPIPLRTCTSTARPRRAQGRKMGHVTEVEPMTASARSSSWSRAPTTA